MPYPWWVDRPRRQKVIERVRSLVSQAGAGRVWSHEDGSVREVGRLFEWEEGEYRADSGFGLASSRGGRREPAGLFG